MGVRGGAFKPYKFDNVRYPAAQLDESQSGTYRPIGDGRVGRFTCQPGFTGLLALTGKGFRRGWSKGTPQTFTCS